MSCPKISLQAKYKIKFILQKKMVDKEDVLKAHLKKVKAILRIGDYVNALRELNAAKNYATRNRIEKLTVEGNEIRAVEEIEDMTLEIVKFALGKGQYRIARYALNKAEEYAEINKIDVSGEIEKLVLRALKV